MDVDNSGVGDISLSSITEEDILNMMRSEGIWNDERPQLDSSSDPAPAETTKAGFQSISQPCDAMSAAQQSNNHNLMSEAILDFLEEQHDIGEAGL